MKKALTFIAALLTTASFIAQGQNDCQTVSEFPWSDGFESLQTFNCWTVLDNNQSVLDNWQRYSSYSHSGSYCARSTYNSSASNSEWLITPALQLPDDASGFVVKWYIRGSTYSGNAAHYTVRISTTGTDTADFADTLFAESYATSTYVERSASLEGYAGQTIHIAFIHDAFNDNSLCIDDVSVYSALVPTVSIGGPALATEGVDITIHATMGEGSTDGLGYSWTSTMEDAGLASLSADGDSVTVTYYSGGTDTIGVTASNDYGSATATMTILVCGTINTFPWSENFNEAWSVQCWTTMSLNSSTNDDWQRTSSYSRSGSSMRSDYCSNGNSNDWLVSPTFAIPDDTEGLTFKWWVRGSTYSGNMAHYSVLVSTSGNAASDFSDTLFAESYGSTTYAERTASLADYAGQNIFIAFVHDSHNDNGMSIDDISIYYALPPVASIEGPSTALEGGNSVFRAVLNEGSTDGLSYSWTSTMEDAGLASLSADGDSITVTYYGGGTDTIGLTVSNNYGSTTVATMVNVCGTVNELPWTEGFNSATSLLCWTVMSFDASSSDDWQRYTSNTNTGSGCVRSNYNASTQANDWLVSPLIAIPTDAEGLVLEWYMRGSSYNGDAAHYTVLVSTSGTDTAAFTDTLYAESLSATTYSQRTASLAAYTGQNIHVAFVHDSYNDNGIYLDDVGVRSAVVPTVAIHAPQRAFTGDNVIVYANLTEGSEDGLVYTWSNTMSTATLVATGDTLSVVYTEAGTDTITVVASNTYGDDTAWTAITVVDCQPISEFPWSESFENTSVLDCWMTIDANTSSNDNWQHSTSYGNTGNGCMYSAYNTATTSNDWLVSPKLTLPDDADGMILEWYVRGSTYSSNTAHYSVLVSTTGSATGNFTDTLFAESYGTATYVGRTASLDAYAGLTIRVAFVHDSYNDNGIRLDDIGVRSAMLPVVSLSAPTSVFTGDVVSLTATLDEGSTSGLSYTWSSTIGTITGNGATATVSYTTGGSDVVSVTATNAYGSATATALITVIDCTPISAFPWNEGFESGTAALQCWTLIDNDGLADDNWNVSTNEGTPHSGSYSLRGGYYEYGTCDDYAISPAFVLPSDATDFVLSYYILGGNYMGNETSYEVLVSTTGTSIDDFSTVLFNETYGGEYVQRSLSLAPYAGQTIRFAFRNTSYDADGIYFDDLTIGQGTADPQPGPGPQPSCIAPTNVAAINVATTSATITWIATGADSYEVRYGIDIDTTSGIFVSAQNNMTVLADLVASTTYDVYVRSVCEDGGHSLWTQRYQFTTTDEGGNNEGIGMLPDVSVSVSPNPATTEVRVSAEGMHSLEIIDISGRIVLTRSNIADGSATIGIHGIAPGLYFIRIHGEDYTQVRKLMVASGQ